MAQIRLFNVANDPFQVAPFEQIHAFETGTEFSLQNGYVKADFDANGFLTAITTLDDKVKTNVKLEFINYGTRKSGDKSGAYLFLPDGPAQPLSVERPKVKIIQGKILSYVEVEMTFGKHKVWLKNSPGVDGTGLQIDNEIDINSMNNREIAMRLTSEVDSGDEFFTHLNGFQMIKRKRLSKIPLQGNYYPVPTMAYIQDEQR